jgi:hypothetical protein
MIFLTQFSKSHPVLDSTPKLRFTGFSASPAVIVMGKICSAKICSAKICSASYAASVCGIKSPAVLHHARPPPPRCRLTKTLPTSTAESGLQLCSSAQGRNRALCFIDSGFKLLTFKHQLSFRSSYTPR